MAKREEETGELKIGQRETLKRGKEKGAEGTVPTDSRITGTQVRCHDDP